MDVVLPVRSALCPRPANSVLRYRDQHRSRNGCSLAHWSLERSDRRRIGRDANALGPALVLCKGVGVPLRERCRLNRDRLPCRAELVGNNLRQRGPDPLAGLDLRADLSRIKVPVLVLVGEQDEATPPAMSKELAAGLPDAELRIIPGCAHVPQLQAPELFLDAIADFLKLVNTASA